MFSFLRSLQWRLVFILVSITIVLMTFVYVILNRKVESSYYETFKNTIDKGCFKDWDISDQPDESEILRYLKDERYAMILFSVSDKKPCTIYNIKTKRIVYTWDANYGIEDNKEAADDYILEIQKSQNTISALAYGAGGNGKLIRTGKSVFFDYAVVKGDFLLYFRCYSEVWLPVVKNFNNIILSSSVFAIIASLIIGFILSKTITSPIISIMHRAQKVAAGDFDQTLQVRADDEIGKLTEAFNYMAKELKNTLIEISSEKNKIETILNYMTDGIIAFNIKGEVIHINPAAKRMLGINDFNQSFNGFCRQYGLGISLEDISYLGSSAGRERDFNIDQKTVRIYFAVFTDEEKKAEGIIAVLQDITEQQKLEKMRKEFVANVSHELRTPLTSIKSYTETLLDGALDEGGTAQKFLSVISSEADRMTRLVKDLLQLSRLDNQQMQWNIKNISLVNLVKNSIEKIQIEARNKDQALDSYVIGELPDIKADPDRIEQVILNILSNAIKYTPNGGKITVYTGRIYSEVYMKVIDNGIGIPEEELPRIFERFYRVDKARSREMGGTGLGLSIAREIVEAHGGSIIINSEIDKGTEVTIKLPVEPLDV